MEKLYKLHFGLIGMIDCLLMWVITSIDKIEEAQKMWILFIGGIIAVLSLGIKLMQFVDQFRKTFNKKK